MKLKKEHVAIVFLLVAFIVFFLNVMLVLGDKNAKIHHLKKENEALRKAYSALERDHAELRKEKLQTIGELRERLNQPGKEAQEEDSRGNE